MDGDRESLAYLQLSDLPDLVTVTMSTVYDAAGHPLEVSFPVGMSQRSTWNAAGLLARLEYDRGDGAGPAIAIDRVAYNARGQAASWRHGNGVETTRDYDPALELLTRIATQAPGAMLQDLRYAYDPIGNVVEITDALSPTPIVANLVVPNTRTFRYDPRYRLVRSTGKRHREAATGVDDVLISNPDPNDYRRYTMRYGYDPVGNFTTNEEYASARDAMRYKDGRIDCSTATPKRRSTTIPSAATGATTQRELPAHAAAGRARLHGRRSAALRRSQWWGTDPLSASW